jgi:hypothetical protein
MMSLGQVVLAPEEREELERRARSRSLAAELVKRAKVILMLAEDHSYREISERLTSAPGNCVFSKIGWLDWIHVIVAPSIDDEPLKPKRAFWN